MSLTKATQSNTLAAAAEGEQEIVFLIDQCSNQRRITHINIAKCMALYYSLVDSIIIRYYFVEFNELFPNQTNSALYISSKNILKVVPVILFILSASCWFAHFISMNGIKMR